MKSEDKIVELLSDMLIRHDQMVLSLDVLKKSQAKTNIELSEMRLSVMKIADQLNITNEHEKRLTRLENKVFN